MRVAASLSSRTGQRVAFPPPDTLESSQGLRKCKTYGCTYYEYTPGSYKCLSCLKGIKSGPFATSASAGAGASLSPPAQSSFQSMFSAPDPLTKGLRITVAPEEVNNMFAWLTMADTPRREKALARNWKT